MVGTLFTRSPGGVPFRSPGGVRGRGGAPGMLIEALSAPQTPSFAATPFRDPVPINATTSPDINAGTFFGSYFDYGGYERFPKAPSGNATPVPTFFTLPGAVELVGESITYNYRVTNTGKSTLKLTGDPLIVVGGADVSSFAVTSQPSSDEIAPNEFELFSVTYDPADAGDFAPVFPTLRGTTGIHDAAISIESNAGESVFSSFAVSGEQWLQGPNHFGALPASLTLETDESDESGTQGAQANEPFPDGFNGSVYSVSKTITRGTGPDVANDFEYYGVFRRPDTNARFIEYSLRALPFGNTIRWHLVFVEDIGNPSLIFYATLDGNAPQGVYTIAPGLSAFVQAWGFPLSVSIG